MSTSADPAITLEYPSDPRLSVVGRLVVGGLASRFELPVDRVDDLLLATETLAEHRFASDRACFEADAEAGGLVLRIGPYPDDPLADGGTARVIRPLVDAADSERRASGYWIELSLSGTKRPSGG